MAESNFFVQEEKMQLIYYENEVEKWQQLN